MKACLDRLYTLVNVSTDSEAGPPETLQPRSIEPIADKLQLVQLSTITGENKSKGYSFDVETRNEG